MIKKIRIFFEQLIVLENPTQEQQEHSLNLAIAAVMLEMVGMDNQVTEDEIRQLSVSLKERLGLSQQEIAEISQLANESLQNSTDYYQFTSLINEHYQLPQKCQIIENLWQIALADGKIDSHEEHYLRKIADLLFVPHKEFIKTKLRVLDSTE